jgi:hypothetical protein
MEKQELLDREIGEDKPMLTAKAVKVVEISWETVTNQGKTLGEKVRLECKHPDSNENIQIGGCKYIINSQVKQSGLWLKLDSDGLISGRSALAVMLRHYGKKTLSALKGTTVNTEVDDNGYLLVRAY